MHTARTPGNTKGRFMKNRFLRRSCCMLLTVLFLFGASFPANAGNGTQFGGTGVGYRTFGWNLTGGISHIHYSYNDNAGATVYSTASGYDYKPRALYGCTSWDSALSSAIFHLYKHCYFRPGHSL